MRLRILGLCFLPALVLGLLPAPVAAADGVTIDARTMLDGHARVGSWMAIDVHVKNDGPAIDGELRVAGGSQGRTRFGVVADLPTGSDKHFQLYAQPPAFGQQLDIVLVEGDQTIASTKADFKIHDGSQLVVGILAERPGDIVSAIDLLPNQNQLAPVIIPLTLDSLPTRVEGWSGLDRIVWQDLDSGRLTDDQLRALRGWVASGGRLVIVGGTNGPNGLSAFPDTLLPYRPTATVEVAASSLAGLLGSIPTGATDVPALGGDLIQGRTLLTNGDSVIAADRPYGSGAVTVIGFDPTTKWIADNKASETLWRRVLPSRIATGLILGDDSQLVQAVAQLPALALPPVGGLIALLAAYILLIGPINYLVLRRLDRREWAWITMPILIVAFAVGAYAFGATLRGSDLLVNEVAIVRGAPGATDGQAQIYVGVFSPTRGSYQIDVPGGALLSSPISGDFFGGDGTGAALDVLQGDPARIRELAVGYGSLRAIRAETPVVVPLVETDLRLDGGRLKGTIKNASTVALQSPAVILGSTVATLPDLAPGASTDIDVAIQPVRFDQTLSDRVVGQLFYGDNGQLAADMNDKYIRHTVIDQLTYDPNFGGNQGSLNADGPVVVAWGSGTLLPVDVVGQRPRSTGNILYYLPASMAVRGDTTFRGDLIRSTTIDADVMNFSKDPYSMYLGAGQATISYRPLPFDGTFTPTDLTLGLVPGPDQGFVGDAQPITPLPAIPPPCKDPVADGCTRAGNEGVPEVEVFDRVKNDWVRLPHLVLNARYRLADPVSYVDPSGTVLVRFVNETDGVGFSFDIGIGGTIK